MWLASLIPRHFFSGPWVLGNEASVLRICENIHKSHWWTLLLHVDKSHSPSPPTGRISVGVTHDLLIVWVCKGTRWGAGGGRDCSCPRRSKKPLYLRNSLQRSQTTKVVMLHFVFVFSHRHLEKMWQGLRKRKSFWANKPREGWLTEQVRVTSYLPISLPGSCTW